MCSTNKFRFPHFRLAPVLELSAGDFCYKLNLVVGKKGG